MIKITTRSKNLYFTQFIFDSVSKIDFVNVSLYRQVDGTKKAELNCKGSAAPRQSTDNKGHGSVRIMVFESRFRSFFISAKREKKGLALNLKMSSSVICMWSPP